MDGANADSDHSMTWEDFFGSTTDLTPTLIGIYDSLLEPAKSRPETNVLEKAKDARNDPPVISQRIEDKMIGETKKSALDSSRTLPKDPSKIAGSVKLPIATVNKSSLYSIRTVSENDVSEGDCGLTTSESLLKEKVHGTIKDIKVVDATFDNLSPNVKRMISGATETTGLKFQKKTATIGRASMRHKTNLPLVGATSKISQSGVEILPSVEIYDQPCGMKTFGRSKTNDNESPSKCTALVKPNFIVNEEQSTYDVPTNNRPVLYDVPNSITKTAFESLSLPFIDQSIELSISSNDREFDIKLSSKENSPQKCDNRTMEESPAKIPKTIHEGTNSTHKKDDVQTDHKLTNTEPYHEVTGSTGNLKSGCVLEKERTNPPSLEVTRPLSMSSIASSSSTSSSGVQNKGGVNSAYLASIESLDDHSDADMTSANGSNHFVNNAGILNNGASEQRHSEDLSGEPDSTSELSQLERVCAEIVQTENVYVEDLRQVVEGYLHEWRRETTFSEDELSELFNNIEDIFAFNRSLCAELNSCRLDATCIARCFVDNTTGFSIYTSYCTGYPRTMERLAALASNTHSAREFRERQLALGHPLPLASYLLKPVQRILKYHLLLQNVVKQCASRETEYALLKMTGIAQHIDDMKRRHEHAVRVQEIQSLLYGWNGLDLTTYGELCAEGTFRVFGAKAMRHAFLFDKMLLITKNREDGILAYKSHIMCNNMMLVESIAGAPLSFHVIPWDAPRAQLTLQARSHRHKREWTLLLKRVILENYNAVIPSHARQLVMELGQNKTDDDMLAEKSHNLITQASMRKQLSAPEYLEKRKLERDRRKSFENGVRGRFKKANRKYTLPISRSESQDCDCAQISTEKGTDYTCDNCYIDLCSDCETEFNKDKKDDKCDCKNDDNEYTGSKCTDCDKRLEYIDAGSAENIERKPIDCKCSDFKSSQESFGKEFTNTLNKTRGYHSSDNIINYANNSKSKEDLSDTNMVNVRNVPKTCLKCSKIKENIVYVDSVNSLHSRKSRCNDIIDKSKTDTLRSKSKEDPNRSKLSKIGTWRRKSEPGLQQNSASAIKKYQDSDNERSEVKGSEKIEFECRNCGSNKITKKVKINETLLISDLDGDGKSCNMSITKPNIEIKMYNTKHIPKKISKIKKNRAKGLRLGSDTTAKFYADLSTDVSTENILHISESNDSLNIEKPKDQQDKITPAMLSKDEDIDEETYKKLIEKTDSFKKNELEKVKYLNKQKVINEGSEIEEKNEIERQEEVIESYEEGEQPLEQIISQLLMQNREFQKLLKKQQQRNSAQRRHQRLLKSHSTPEQVIIARNSELTKLKPKYGRQTSEIFDGNINEDISNIHTQNSVDQSEDDHIYETLRVDGRVDESLHSLDVKSKSIQHNPHISRPKRIPSPPNDIRSTSKNGPLESDYVYLSFDQIKNDQNNDVIYDVPSKYPEKVGEETKSDYYVTMENNGPPTAHPDNLYDNLVEVCRRKKEDSDPAVSDYLPMSVDQNPNTPEIWLSRQKEHFNVSRDRKSGSLPRSFQVPVTNNLEDNNLTSFKFKPNSNSKTYLNRDGKVMSSDRPYTIASDKSEISFDDVENYMSESDILKFNKSTNSSEIDYAQNISQSTLELEEEIDRCYKNNFEEVNLDKNKNDDQLTVSQPNLNTSTTSSCEVLPTERDANKPKDIEIIHPEHKIYKPTSNILSLKNVLNRFKNRNPSKNADEIEINANDQINPDSKTDLKSPTTEKRAALNPRNYSKNLLQRFKSIISDEYADNNQNKSDLSSTKKINEDPQSKTNNGVKVDVTSSGASPLTSSSVNSTNNDLLSKSVCENTTMTDSQNAKNNLEELSHSCDNLNEKPELFRPFFIKSCSLTSSTLTTTESASSSPAKSNNSSYQSLNKLPIYMQGSKHLGARIAQSDYVDPTTLTTEKSTLKLVNVLINKNSMRPDSLFSNSSFVTSSSEGTYQEGHNKGNVNTADLKDSTKQASSSQFISDDSFYEKSFEMIEQVKDVDVFRDSAVYSDQEECEENKMETERTKAIKKVVNRLSSVKCMEASAQKVKITSSICEKVSTNPQNKLINKTPYQMTKNNTEKSCQNIEKTTKPKIAPPVPMKPKISSMQNSQPLQNKLASRSNLIKTTEHSLSLEKVNVKTTINSSNTIHKQTYARSESTPTETKSKIVVVKTSKSEEETLNTESCHNEDSETNQSKSQGSIQMKRLSFERASLDSATRKLKTVDKRMTIEPSKTSKSVLERRMELEQLTKTQKPNTLKKPTQNTRPKSITMKVATFERTVSENGRKDERVAPGCSEKANIPQRATTTDDKIETNPEVEAKGSWVKQVVNKFQ